MSKTNIAIQVFTDGSCRPKKHPNGDYHGPGGWAAIVIVDGVTTELTGGEHQTTSNRMELMAVITGLEHTMDWLGAAHITSDSKYVVDNATKQLKRWRKNGYMGWANGPVPIRNQNLWERLDAALNATGRRITWEWVRAHNKHPENERADSLAVSARNQHIQNHAAPINRPAWLEIEIAKIGDTKPGRRNFMYRGPKKG